MYPNKNPISGINSFLNKQFGVPLPSSSSSYGISSYKKPVATSTGPNMSYAPVTTKPGQNMSYANPSATNTKPVVITTPTEKKKNVLPPAGEKFVQDAYDKTTGARTDYGASIGVPEMYGGKPIIKGNETSTNPNMGASTETVAPPKTPESPYLTYLRSMFDPESLKTASEKATSDVERLSGIKNESEAKELESRRLYEATLDKSGGLLSGARQEAGGISRKTNQELADLALRESAAARTADVSTNVYNQMIGAGKSVYEAEVAAEKAKKEAAGEGFTLGKDQIRYDAAGNPIASGGSGAGGGTEAPTIKTFGQTDYQWNTETGQWDPVTTSNTSPQAKVDKATKLLADIGILKGTAGFEGAVGAKGISSLFGLKGTPIAGSPAADYRARLDSIKGQLTLENMGVMKGVLSDSDIKIITQASTALSPDMSEAEFKKELAKIEAIMQKVVDNSGASSGGTTGDSIWDF